MPCPSCTTCTTFFCKQVRIDFVVFDFLKIQPKTLVQLVQLVQIRSSPVSTWCVACPSNSILLVQHWYNWYKIDVPPIAGGGLLLVSYQLASTTC